MLAPGKKYKVAVAEYRGSGMFKSSLTSPIQKLTQDRLTDFTVVGQAEYDILQSAAANYGLTVITIPEDQEIFVKKTIACYLAQVEADMQAKRDEQTRREELDRQRRQQEKEYQERQEKDRLRQLIKKHGLPDDVQINSETGSSTSSYFPPKLAIPPLGYKG
jgi:hypothetical protein